MPKSWRFPPFDEFVVNQLSRDLKLPALLAQVLAARGFRDGPSAAGFLSAKLADLHDPGLLPGVPEAVDRIVAAVQAGRRVTIYGDYDVDGVTSTAMLWHCLQLLGAQVDYYIPHRLEEGYGLNCDALRQLHEEDPQRLVVTVDCGITSVREAELARELGLELIITDHHTFADSLPAAAALVHPRLPGGGYPFGDLCGAGVAFKLAWAICQRLGDGKKATPRMREFLLFAIGLAAIGTIADVVPLIDENRTIVRYGLASITERCSDGLKALIRSAGLEPRVIVNTEDIRFRIAPRVNAPGLEANKNNKPYMTYAVDDVGFGIGPRINAAGRLGQARLAVELLVSHDEGRINQLVSLFNELNDNRKTVERRILKQAKELVVENPDWQAQAALVLAHAEWHPGVIGIVASRVAEHFQKPTILISLHRPDEPGQGSGRSFAGFDLHAGLTACAGHLRSYGGHRAAAGLKIEAARIDAFRAEFCQYVAEHHEVRSSDLELAVDAEVRLADLTHRAVTQLESLGPFGEGNKRPIFAATKVELAGTPRRMGDDGRHLDLRVRHYGTTMRAVAFGQGDWAEEIAAVNGPISICFAPVINRFRGYESVELQLIDWQPGPPRAD